MAEYIDREALLQEYDRQHQGPPGKARKLIEEFPASYVDEVVYCNECKFGEMMKNGCTVFCHKIGTVKTAFSYCSSAERKVNVENYCGDS